MRHTNFTACQKMNPLLGLARKQRKQKTLRGFLLPLLFVAVLLTLRETRVCSVRRLLVFALGDADFGRGVSVLKDL